MSAIRATPLLELRVTHPYYSDGRCADFVIEPSEAGATLMRGLRLGWKRLADGLRVFSTAERLAIAPGGSMLEFVMRLRTPNFPHFTELPPLSAKHHRCFVSGPSGIGNPARLELSEHEGEDHPDVFARVEVPLRDIAARPNSASGLLPTFEVPFAAARARWCYYVVERRGPGEGWTIADITPRGTGGGSGLPDGGPGTFAVARDPEDEVGRTLRLRHPRADLLRFLSTQPVICRASPGRTLQLCSGEHTVFGPLPIPRPEDVLLPRDESGSVADAPATIYRIINFAMV